MKQQQDYKPAHGIHFDSVLALSEYIESGWQDWEQGKHSGSTFTDCMTHQKARAILAQGAYWPEGEERMQKAALKLDKIPQSTVDVPMPDNYIVGHKANVGAFLAGSPYSMTRYVYTPMDDKRCRMLVSVAGSGMVKHQALMNRGAAIMGAIDNLQSQGYAVELTVGFFITNHSSGKGGEQVHYTVTVKNFQDTYTPAALAFVLAEPSFFRRNLFSVFDIDLQQTKHPLLDSMKINLGYPVSKMDHLPFDIVYESLHGTDGWTAENSADKAMERVYKWLERNKSEAAA